MSSLPSRLMSATVTLSLRPRSIVCLRKGISSDPAAFNPVAFHQRQVAATRANTIPPLARTRILPKKKMTRPALSRSEFLLSACGLLLSADRLWLTNYRLSSVLCLQLFGQPLDELDPTLRQFVA